MSFPASASFYAAVGKVDISPDPKARTVWMAGYGDSGRKAQGLHDRFYARAVVVSDGERTVAMVALDLIGLFHEDVEAIRRRLDLDPRRQALLIAATHTHAGPDTLGLWGPMQGVSGVDKAYRREIHEKVVALVKRLVGNLQDAELVSTVKAIEMKGRCQDMRDPVVMNPDLAVLRFVSRRDKSVIGTVMDWSCHPEVLGRENFQLSTDFAGAACTALEEKSGAPCVYFSGTIGGMQSPDNDALQAGGKDEFAAAQALGEIIAREAEAALPGATRTTPSRVDFRSEPVRLTIENSKYLTFLPALAFGHTLYRPSGETIGTIGQITTSLRHALFRLDPAQYPKIDTEVMRIRFGPVDILALPGELLPELYEGGYDGKYRFGYPLVSPGNPSPPDLVAAPKGPYLKDRMKGKQRFIIGLANDEIGYILPAYDFRTNTTLLMHPYPAGHHYEESNSVGKETTEKITAAALKVLSDE